MNTEYLDLKKKFDNDGYFIYKNFFPKEFISDLVEEINQSEGTVRYYDNQNFLRRIEKLYDKGEKLRKLNDKILVLLKGVFDKSFLQICSAISLPLIGSFSFISI